jgi:dipeptidyl aminopeptidase/acylaminoacyl peptidase
MNRSARNFIDELVDAIYKQHHLPERTPLISTGGSMGGHAALLYTRYAKRPVKACMALYPVCDLKYHFSERPDLPRTILCAFRDYPEDMDTLFAEHSPVSQVAQMPRIPYLIVHGDDDKAVSKVHHSDRMVDAMRRKKLKVDYVEVPGMGHGGPIPIQVIEKNIRFVARFL